MVFPETTKKVIVKFIKKWKSQSKNTLLVAILTIKK